MCLKCACNGTVKTTGKPPQPIEKEHGRSEFTGASDGLEVRDHQPLDEQEKRLEPHGVEISRKTVGGWLAQWAALLDPLYWAMKKELFGSKVSGTDDTSVKCWTANFRTPGLGESGLTWEPRRPIA
jgi:hypothetical protein